MPDVYENYDGDVDDAYDDVAIVDQLSVWLQGVAGGYRVSAIGPRPLLAWLCACGCRWVLRGRVWFTPPGGG